jgi:hypothetical protein
MTLDYKTLNPRFVQQQGIKDQETINLISDTHLQLDRVMNTMEKLDPVNSEEDRQQLYAYRRQITELDFTLQDLWGFERDITKHTWLPRAPWNMIP